MSVFRFITFASGIFISVFLNAQSIPYDQLSEIRKKIETLPVPDKNKNDVVTFENFDKPNYDGPIDSSKWYLKEKRKIKTDDRILFVLKEPWGNGNVDWPAVLRSRKTLSEFGGGGVGTYKPLVSIVNMLVRGCTYDSILNNIYSQDCYTIFKDCSAIIEVNKFSGYTRSVDSEIAAFARKNLDLLSRQIDVYKPTVVVICAGNGASNVFIKEEGPNYNIYNIFGKIVPANKRPVVNSKNYKWFQYPTNDCLYIVTYHPNAYINKKEYCTAIVKAIRDWKNQK